MPHGFDINNSPAEMELRDDTWRPTIVVSSSGTVLLDNLICYNSIYVACFRNYSATVHYVLLKHNHIAIVGAQTRNEFREEDQLCCAWIADGLMKAGYKARNRKTAEVVDCWRNQSVDACTKGKSAEFLHKTGQTKALDFIVSHVNDLNLVLAVKQSEIVRL
jgi:2-phosphosulfolactate phosphatase